MGHFTFEFEHVVEHQVGDHHQGCLLHIDVRGVQGQVETASVSFYVIRESFEQITERDQEVDL